MSRTDYLKPVKTLDFDFVFSGCPIELCKGTIYSEVEDHRLFCSLGYKNMSDKTVHSMGVKLWLYDSDKANHPYMKIPLQYDLTQSPEGYYASVVGLKDKEHIARPGKKFGREYFFPMPESYFVRLAVVIEWVGFSDGSRLKVQNVTTTNYRHIDKDFDEFEKKAYERINIYRRLEKQHPSKVVPMEQELLWICCCGEKNAHTEEKCSLCGREKKWQLENLSKEAIESRAEELKEEKTNDVAFFARAKARNNAVSTLQEKERDRIRKEQEAALLNVAQQEKRMNLRKAICFVIILGWIFASVAFYFLSKG